MSPEAIRGQESNSETLANPEILLEKVRAVSEHPEDKTGRAMFREWLLKDWKKINKFILQFPSRKQPANEGYIIRSVALGNYGFYKDPNSEFFSGHLQEEMPLFSSLKGIDRIKIRLYHESEKTKELKKKGGKDIHMDVLFIVDSEKRDNLVGLSIRSNRGSFDDFFKSVGEHFEVKISPELEIAKLK